MVEKAVEKYNLTSVRTILIGMSFCPSPEGEGIELVSFLVDDILSFKINKTYKAARCKTN